MKKRLLSANGVADKIKNLDLSSTDAKDLQKVLEDIKKNKVYNAKELASGIFQAPVNGSGLKIVYGQRSDTVVFLDITKGDISLTS